MILQGEGSTKMRTSALFLLLTIALFFVLGCGADNDVDDEQAYGEVNGWEFKRMTISVGENPLPPEDVGVIGTESRERKVITGHDLASFGERWNEAVDELDLQGLSLDELDIVYQKPVVSAQYDFEDWLMVYTSTCYDTGHLEYTAVEWEITPDMVGETITGSWAALIYATIPYMSVEDLSGTISELGIYDLSTDELADYELQTVIGDYQYWFYSTDTWGDFEITPK